MDYTVNGIKLKWSDVVPSEYGFYWVNFRIGTVDIKVVVRYPLEGTEENMHLANKWLGPIPEPEL